MRPASIYGRLAVALLSAGAFGRLALAQEASAFGLDQVEAEISSVSFVLEGSVLEPDGAPAEGAVVVSSAGGQAAAGPDGRYRLEVSMPLDAESVHVMAVGSHSGSLRASASITLAPEAGHAWVAPLQLAQEGACGPSWLPTFGQLPGTEDTVRALTVFDDGTGNALYVGGDFEQAGNATVSGIAKWDGTSWTAVGGGLNGTVYALAVHDYGLGDELFAGGSFTTAGGVTVNRIARWNGTSWDKLGPGDGMGGRGGGFGTPLVYALAVYDDGNGDALYVGGTFATAGGVTVNRIARWDGPGWAALGSGMNSAVDALAVYDDGSGSALYAGGFFSTADGVAASRIATWDGTSWTALGSGLSGGFLRALAVYDDGSGSALYASGSFLTAGGAAATRIAKWDGTSWTALGSGLGSTNPGETESVVALTTYDDGSGNALYAYGGFTIAGGVPANRIARWDGTSWTALGIGLGSPFDDFVSALTVYDDGTGSALYVGGDFRSAGGAPANFIARWDGASWGVFGSGLNDSVNALASYTDPGGKALYAGGHFTGAGTTEASQIARWDGASWSSLGSGVNLGVYSLATCDHGTGNGLFVGGRFDEAGGMPVGQIARWDGASWSPLSSGVSQFSHVWALTEYDDGSGPALCAGGNFNIAGGGAVNNLARWDGSSWLGLGSGTNMEVYALTEYDDGGGSALYAGGFFTQAGGMPASRIAKWDGSSWSALGSGTMGSGMGSSVNALTVYDDGGGPALYMGGDFTKAGGLAANRIARWDGSSWTTLGDGFNSTVLTLAVFDDGTGSALYAGGTFTTAGGLAANRIAKWDGSSWTALGSGLSGIVRALAVHDDGSGPALYVGGDFASAIDSGDSFLARWGCPGPPPPTTYCTGKTTSAGCVPFLSHSGTASATSSGAFNIFSNDHLEGEIGTYIYSFEKANLNFHGGKLCVKAPIRRVVGLIKTTDGIPCTSCAGNCRTFKRNFNALIQSGADPLLTPGQSVKVQAQQRDPLDPFVDNLSNGIAFVIGP